MRILKFLNKKYFSTIIIFFLLFSANLKAEDEPSDIWNLEKKDNQNSSTITSENEESNKTKIDINKLDPKNTISTIDSDTLEDNRIDIVGLYDPEENGLNIDIWSNSDGNEIKLILNKLNKMNLSKDSNEILNIALLTNSYFPKENITEEEFIDFKIKYLIKNDDKSLIKLYLIKNEKNIYNSKLIKFFINDYIENADLENACKIFDEIKYIGDDYINKFQIYCLINQKKREEAQLLYDLNQESGYWIVMNDADELSILGTPINPETSYALDEGSNLIGYPLNTNTEVLAGLGSEVDAGNIYAIFGEGISAYNYGGLWIGSLQYFTPNSGYWFLSNADIDFVYDNSDDLGRNSIEFTEVPKNPENFEYNQSKKQSFYYVESIEDIEINDWVLAYNNDVLVGARQYNGSMVDIPVMGDDNTEFTAGYCQEGDVPQFKLYRASNGMLNDLSGNINLWTSNSVDVIDNLSTTNIPTEISLSPAYPNPFNPSTNLSYNVPQDTHIKLSVYDINGRLVENLVNSYQDAGSYNTVWNASAVSSGVYFVTLTTSSDMLTQKIMLIK